MTEHDDERLVSRHYRELPAEEPPRQLDDAVRARARSALETVPAPLVPPTGRRRWYFPVAAAAILVLAVAVTWHIEREQPDAYVASTPEAAQEAPSLARDEVALARKPMPKERAAESREEAGARAPVPAAPPAPAAPRARADAAPEPQAGAAARSEVLAQRALTETPEQMLERIAKLRAEGRHEEADTLLAEFRKRYPDFRIPPETLEKVEKR